MLRGGLIAEWATSKVLDDNFGSAAGDGADKWVEIVAKQIPTTVLEFIVDEHAKIRKKFSFKIFIF